jgi:hypothetical protein
LLESKQFPLRPIQKLQKTTSHFGNAQFLSTTMTSRNSSNPIHQTNPPNKKTKEGTIATSKKESRKKQTTICAILKSPEV